MQLGSPASPGASGYLPNFLMGGVENQQTVNYSFCEFLLKMFLNFDSN